MTISIPTNSDLITTDVVDVTPTWDNGEYTPYLSPEMKFQHNGEIFQYTSAIAYEVLTYDAGATYEDKQIIYKDSLMQQANSGTAPKAPSLYTSTCTGWSHTAWDCRYAKLQDMPPNFVNKVEQTRPFAPYYSMREMYWAGDGYHLYLTLGGSSIYHYEVTEPYVMPPVGTSATSSKHFGLSCNGMYVNNAGTHIYFLFTTSSIESNWHCTGYTFDTAYDLSTANTNIGYVPQVDGGWERITVSGDGKVLYVTTATDVLSFNMATAHTPNLTTTGPILSSYVTLSGIGIIKSIKADLVGDKLYLLAGNSTKEKVWEFDLSTANNLASATITSYKKVDVGAGCLFLRTDGLGFFIIIGSISKTYTNVTPWDTAESMHDVNNHNFIDTADTYNRVMSLVDGTTFNVKYYDSGWIEVLSTSYDSVNIYNGLTSESLDYAADIQAETWYTVWLGKTFIIDDDGLYVRTHLDVTKEISGDADTFNYIPVATPQILPNFVYLEDTDDNKPFDGKNYSIATTATGTMSYTLVATEAFDTVTLGNVKADHVYIEFRPVGWVEGDTPTATIDRDIDTTRDDHGHLAQWKTTLIFYSIDNGDVSNSNIMAKDSTIFITLTSTSDIELATLMLGMSAGAGFTNLELKNEYKDFSTFEYDVWGYADYIERAKVSRYSGTVDIPITSYDMTDRLMTSLGKNLVIINGSDWASCSCDSETIFNATQKIGRFMNFNQQTKVKDGDMDVVATYSFTFEEIT